MKHDINSLLAIINQLTEDNNQLKSKLTTFKEFGLMVPTDTTTTFDQCILSKPMTFEHTLIEGDNAQALHLLQQTHSGLIDVIYIDPPYNTQKSDFRYKDKMQHATWLTFMKTRLSLAKKLLSSSGSIFISIDDNEQAFLKILCDEIFGEENFIANFIWKKSHTVKNDKKGISTQHEYVLCYANNKSTVHFNREPIGESYIKQSYRLKDAKGIFRTVPLHKKKNNTSYTVTAPNGKEWTMPWNYNSEGFQKLMDEDMIYWGKDGNACPNKKVYLKDKMDKTFGSMLSPETVKYTGSGGIMLEQLGFNKTDFIYAKPVELIRHFINVASKPNSIILDFFAGSGTTAQAVMEANQADGGERTFIVCTNNENKICSDITWPRIKAAQKLLNNNDHVNYLFVKNNDNDG